jgi:hypothetical protein
MSVKIQAEIYKYRARSGIYQPRSRNEVLDGILSSQGPVENKTTESSDAPRKLFSDQITNMVQQARTAVSLSSLKDPPLKFRKSVTQELLQTRDKMRKRLRADYVHPLEDIENIMTSGPETVLQEDVPDGGFSVITAEDYVKFRVEPNVKKMQKVLPQRGFLYSLCMVLVLISTLSSGVLGFIGLNAYIPLAAAFASSIDSLSSYHRLRDRLTATNAALTQLQSLLVWYRGLSMVERRLSHNKNHLVDVTEAALLAELAVISPGGGEARPVVADDDSEYGNDKGKEKKN